MQGLWKYINLTLILTLTLTLTMCLTGRGGDIKFLLHNYGGKILCIGPHKFPLPSYRGEFLCPPHKISPPREGKGCVITHIKFPLHGRSKISFCVVISYAVGYQFLISRPHAFLGPASLAFIVYYIISHSVRIDAADLHVDFLLSELQNSQKMSPSLKHWSACPQTLLLLQGVWPCESKSRTFMQLGNKLWYNGNGRPPAQTFLMRN